MSHRNAPLTPTGRLRPARCVVDDGRPLRRAAERFQVSHTTAARWASRCRQAGEAGMHDRSGRPHHSPRRTPDTVEQQAVRLRREHRIGPARPAARCGIAPSTAHRIPVRHNLPAPATPDRATGEPVRRHEHARPGEPVHIHVKKLGRIPDRGGHKILGRAAGRKNRTGTGPACLHTALDDHSRLAHTEDPPRREGRHLRRLPHPGHRLVRRPGHHRRAGADRQCLGPHEEHLPRHLPEPGDPAAPDPAVATADQRQGRTLPPHPARRVGLHPALHLRPRTTGRVPDRLDRYNYHRPHTGIDGHPPASRVTNLPGQHT
ncbi:IS481 family transposase [Streptomyces griseoviridis]|uniref:IS481 family transposase n=1 Tax=Streptomyces griseoviridis TaxID=45398 RepID=A0A918LE92_STRGD|nr:IS481 family transposase [Streptomyces niveoruber]